MCVCSDVCASLIGDYFHSRGERTTEISECTSLPLRSDCSRLCPTLKHNRSVGISAAGNTVTRSAGAALNSTLAEVAFVNRHTKTSSVEGTEVDFQLLSRDTGYPPFLRARFEDKLFFFFVSTGNMTQGQRARSAHTVTDMADIP